VELDNTAAAFCIITTGKKPNMAKNMEKDSKAAPAGNGAAGRLEWAALAVCALAALVMEAVLFFHAGSFWRDECSSLYVAGQAALPAFWKNLGYDSFPALFDLLLRFWMALGPQDSSGWLRLFGALMFLGVLLSILCSGRVLGGRPPVLAVSLVALNLTVFYYGSSLRAYGLAALLITLFFSAVWRFCLEPSRRNAALSLTLAVLSAHASYQNSCLIFGIGAAAVAVCLAAEMRRSALIVLGVCLAAALSMLVYLPVIEAYRAGSGVSHSPLDWRLIFSNAAMTLSGDYRGLNAPLRTLWLLLLAVAIVSLAVQSFRYLRRAGKKEPSAALYAFTTLAAGGAAWLAFMKFSTAFPNPWQFIPLVALAGIAVDMGIRPPREAAWGSWLRAALACLIAIFSIKPLWTAAVASTAAREAGPQDLLLVSPFWLAPGFQRHYSGKAPWTTMPAIAETPGAPLADFSNVQKLMLDPGGSLLPTQALIKKTLSAGHLVFMTGDLRFLPPGSLLPPLLPATSAPYGWANGAWAEIWMLHTAYFLQSHAQNVWRFDIPVPGPVDPTENVQLYAFKGWH